MPRAQLKAKIPGGPAVLSAQHPDDEFRILASHPTADGLLVILEIQTSDTEALIRDIDEAPWLPSYNMLHADEETLLIQYSVPFVPPPLRAVLASENLPRFPLTIRNGWVISEITTSHERLSQLKDELDATGLTYEVVSVTQSAAPTDLLTDRQRRFMTKALEQGYYDTPARVHSPISRTCWRSASRPRASCSITPKRRLSRNSSQNRSNKLSSHAVPRFTAPRLSRILSSRYRLADLAFVQKLVAFDCVKMFA